MKFFSLLIPLLFLSVFLYAVIKKVHLYDAFSKGIGETLPLILSLFPYLAAILILSELFSASGLSDLLTNALAPVLEKLGIPKEIAPLLLIKPFSGSGAAAVLSEILRKYGADSYIARCACVVFGSSETVFYVSAIYFAGTKKNLFKPVVIALFANGCSAILGCLLCRIL